MRRVTSGKKRAGGCETQSVVDEMERSGATALRESFAQPPDLGMRSPA